MHLIVPCLHVLSHMFWGYQEDKEAQKEAARREKEQIRAAKKVPRTFIRLL